MNKTLTLLLLLLCIISTPCLIASPSESLAQQLKANHGKVIYLDFWASWCGPCRKSFPWMNQMLEKYEAKGFRVITVNLDREKKLAHDFLKEFPANFPIIYDAEGKTAEQYQLKGMPNSFIINRAGEVVTVHVGFRQKKRQQYEQEIQTLLNQ